MPSQSISPVSQAHANQQASSLQASSLQVPSLPGLAHQSRSSSLTAPGFLFVFVTLFLALGAINGQNNLLFWLFGFAISSLVVSGVITGSALMAIRLTAHPLEYTELGQDLVVRYTLHNTSKIFPNFALEIIELGQNPDCIQHTPGVALHIRPKSSASVSACMIPTRRGLYSLSQVRVRSRFPFGLFTKSIDFEMSRQTVIFPKTVALEGSGLARFMPSDDTTNTRSLNRKGSGLDYFALREYQSGDAISSIAWKQSARTDKLLVIEYPEQATDQIVLELLQPADQMDDELFERAISLVYSVLKLTGLQSRVGLVIPWASVSIAPSQGVAHTNRCAHQLALLQRPTQAQPKLSQNPSWRCRSVMIGYKRESDLRDADLFAEDFELGASQ